MTGLFRKKKKKKNIHKESTNDDEFLDRAMLGIRPMNLRMLF